MENDQQAAMLRTQYAISDSDAVAALRQRAADESRKNSDATSRYIRTHSQSSSGVTLRCEAACHQAIGIAQGINVFD
jgi:hypothetical protein